jgi:predicted transposase YdaD
MSSQPSAHDAVFRRVLGEPANPASQLRAVLPGALVDRLDLARLTLVSGSFIDATLRWRHSDLLFTVPLQGVRRWSMLSSSTRAAADTLEDVLR